MKIIDLFKNTERTFSFEFFPPKDEISAVDFGINVGQLLTLNPSFVSVTYGAGGSTQERTFSLVNFLQNKIGLNTMAHYTCVGSSHEKVARDMEYLKSIGIENVMLLRGDPPKGMNSFVPEKDGFNFANELIEFVTRLEYGFSVGAAANPEKHPEATSMDAYIDNLKLKCKAGANFLITQLFFDNNAYYEFVRQVRNAGVSCRIIPGIIPLTGYKQIKKFVDMAATSFPGDLLEKMEFYKDNDDKAYQVGVEHAINQCLDLLINGAPGIHFYTLNKSRSAVEVFESLPSSLK
jgi:methylenetetrahydrofolate reductase (NADPH)